METKELMLGDLVLCDGKVCRVLELGGMACVTPIDKTEELFCNDKDLEPIPLTAEILEKNGWKVNSCGGCNLRYHHWNINIYPNENRIYVNCHKGNFIQGVLDIRDTRGERHPLCIHQLQHALKLCGIDKTIKL